MEFYHLAVSGFPFHILVSMQLKRSIHDAIFDYYLQGLITKHPSSTVTQYFVNIVDRREIES